MVYLGGCPRIHSRAVGKRDREGSGTNRGCVIKPVTPVRPGAESNWGTAGDHVERASLSYSCTQAEGAGLFDMNSGEPWVTECCANS